MDLPIRPRREDEFAIGDIVTRDGSDEHEVIDVNDCGDLIHVRCLKAPSRGWCAVGDDEWNLPRRYSLVMRDITNA